MSDEFTAFADMFDTEIALSKDLSDILSNPSPVSLLMDTEILFKFLCKGPQASKKPTMLYILAVREAHLR